MVARVCVVGSVNADLTFTVDALPRPGQTVLASSLSSSPGGKGGNQAVAASRAGATVQLVAALGTDSAADQLRVHLRDNEVGLDGVVNRPGPSGSAVIIVDSGAENTIVVAPGANAHLTMTSADLRAVIADSDVLQSNLGGRGEIGGPCGQLQYAGGILHGDLRLGSFVIFHSENISSDGRDRSGHAGPRRGCGST